MELYYDFHIHTALSPCGDDDMTPCNIVGMAMLKGLDAIAITDHNTAGNVRAVTQASAALGGALIVPGMELESAENVHLVCLFPSVEIAEEFGAFVRTTLPPIVNKPEIYGLQTQMDASDQVLGTEERLLLNATTIDIGSAIAAVESRGGICYPAHVDRESNGIISILGEIPKAYHFSCVEFSTNASKDLQKAIKNEYNIIYSSDAHYLETISEREHFLKIDHFSVGEVLRALRSPT